MIPITIKKLAFLTLTALFFSAKINGQGPPAPALPSQENEHLIDKIVEVTNHKKYFIDYCTKRVRNFSKQNSWTEEKTKNILGSIDFNDYSFSIYNSYAFYSTTQLKNLLTVLTDLAKAKSGSSFILTNAMMQSNLDLYVEGLIEGKYMR